MKLQNEHDSILATHQLMIKARENLETLVDDHKKKLLGLLKQKLTELDKYWCYFCDQFVDATNPLYVRYWSTTDQGYPCDVKRRLVVPACSACFSNKVGKIIPSGIYEEIEYHEIRGSNAILKKAFYWSPKGGLPSKPTDHDSRSWVSLHDYSQLPTDIQQQCKFDPEKICAVGDDAELCFYPAPVKTKHCEAVGLDVIPIEYFPPRSRGASISGFRVGKEYL